MGEPTRTTICVLDDDSFFRRFISGILSAAGYNVIEAPDGELGLKKLEESNATILIVDILMPIKDGLETIIAAKRFEGLKILAVSGGGILNANVLDWAREFGADDCLAKPFQVRDLLNRVTALQQISEPLNALPCRP